MKRIVKNTIYDLLPFELKQDYVTWRRRKNSKLLRQGSYDGRSLVPYEKHKCIFVHIPKTAGISVLLALFGCMGGGHRSLAEYKRIFTQEEFQSYFICTFVRNPWDRFVSAYTYLRGGGMSHPDQPWAQANQKWAQEHILPYPDFDSFVKEWLTLRRARRSLHFRPQSDFLRGKGCENVVEFVGRFESLHDDFQFLAQRLGLDCKLEKHNVTRERKSYTSYFTDETAELVGNVYREDIERFGYTFEDGLK